MIHSQNSEAARRCQNFSCMSPGSNIEHILYAIYVFFSCFEWIRGGDRFGEIKDFVVLGEYFLGFLDLWMTSNCEIFG